MGMDVHAREIGNEPLIAVGLDVQDEQSLTLLPGAAVAFRAQKHAEFQRHVEPWQTGLGVEFSSREVVDAEPALLNQAEEPIHAGLARVIQLLGGSRAKAASVDRKDQGVEDRRVVIIERAVDEDVVS